MVVSEMAVPKAVALMSGGLDSTVSLAMFLKDHPRGSVVRGITFDYGQRSAPREIQAAEAIAAYYGVPHQVIALPWIGQTIPTHYRASTEKPSWALLEGEASADGVARVWVPNRNGILLNIAAGVAESLGAGSVLFGANLEETEAGFPDNSLDYCQRVTASLFLSTMNHVEVLAPVARMNKAQMIQEAVQLEVPLELLWSCYEAGEDGQRVGPQIQCGVCPSCLLLQNALRVHHQSHRVSFKAVLAN